MSDDQMPGPVDFILIEVPEGADTGATVGALVTLLDRGIVSLYDLALVRGGSGADAGALDPTAPGEPALEPFSALADAASGLFDDDDVRQAAEALGDGALGVMLAYENSWASSFVTAAHAAGGQLVASERIPAQALIDALDAG